MQCIHFHGLGAVVIFWWLWAHKWISSEGAVSALSGAAAPRRAAAAAEASSTCASRLSCTRGPAKGRPVRGAACEHVALVASSYKNSCQHVVHAVHTFPRTRSSRGRPQISSQPAEINNSIQNSTCCRPKPDEVDFFAKTYKPLKEIMHENLSWSGRFFEVLLFVELVAVIIRVYD